MIKAHRLRPTVILRNPSPYIASARLQKFCGTAIGDQLNFGRDIWSYMLRRFLPGLMDERMIWRLHLDL